MKKTTKIIISVLFSVMLISCISLVLYEEFRPRTDKEIERYKSCGNLLEAEAKFYVLTKTDGNTTVITKDHLKEKCDRCKYYVEWDKEKNTYTSYLSCKGYETEGFNKDKLK